MLFKIRWFFSEQNNNDPTHPLLIGSMTEWPDMYPKDQMTILNKLLNKEICMRQMRKMAFRFAKIKYAKLLIHKRVQDHPKYLLLPDSMKKQTRDIAGLIIRCFQFVFQLIDGNS